MLLLDVSTGLKPSSLLNSSYLMYWELGCLITIAINDIKVDLLFNCIIPLSVKSLGMHDGDKVGDKPKLVRA
ncbi:hypothetical protein H5410_009152 [Solanum commersonii]|uniref:Uncharacterized protein n=1 Tax=Solanum commersonii TaxID=4109 RepID=A0A9J6AH22_SOLCO|nr:hypothetical protein H5410_009152 [Solanum commersonii]